MKMSNRCFFFGVLLFAEGVFGVEKYNVTKTVMKGDSVQLNPGDTKIPEDDTAQWWFGDKSIALMNKGANLISTSEGDNAGFKGRLKLDQTGSLTITDTRTTDSGIYKLLIKSTTEIYKTYKVTVEEKHPDDRNRQNFIIVIVLLVMLVLLGIIAKLVIYKKY